MKIAVASDHAGFQLKEFLRIKLDEAGHEVLDVGCYSPERVDYARYTLRLVWELRRDAIGFAELRRRTGISSSVLASRLRELAASGVIEPTGGRRYRLSPAGRELARVLYDLNRWAESAARGRDEVILER